MQCVLDKYCNKFAKLWLIRLLKCMFIPDKYFLIACHSEFVGPKHLKLLEFGEIGTGWCKHDVNSHLSKTAIRQDH